MIVPVMNVREMGMCMPQRRMLVGVHMGLLTIPTVVMRVLVMDVMIV